MDYAIVFSELAPSYGVFPYAAALLGDGAGSHLPVQHPDSSHPLVGSRGLPMAGTCTHLKSVLEMRALWMAFMIPPQAGTDPETHLSFIEIVQYMCSGYSCPTFVCCDLREFAQSVCVSKVFSTKV